VEGLLGSGEALVAGHDLLVLDLDGVVYLGDRSVPGAADALAAVRAAGTGIEFVTNNASRRAEQVAEVLRGHGVAADPGEVITSAQGAGAVLAERLPAGATVLVVGAQALADEIAEVGLRPTRSADDRPAAVVQGYGREVGWEQLAEGAVAIRGGALWAATNLDATLPSPRGPLPGNGSMVAALAAATGRRPDIVVGKPEPVLYELSVRRRGARRPLAVGDRLDTDIEGAVRAGMPSLVVLTGIAGPADLLAAPAGQRPNYLAADLAGLLVPHPAPELAADGRRAGCGGWHAGRDGTDGATLDGSGAPLDALRALCAVAWHGTPVRTVRAASEDAAKAVQDLGLPA
jgi:HAD superfamily hydrolase (TIGR01450 family)